MVFGGFLHEKTLFSQHIPFASVNQKDDQLRASGDISFCSFFAQKKKGPLDFVHILRKVNLDCEKKDRK